MTPFYSAAVRTAVWLGPNRSDQEDESIRELFEMARALGDWMRNESEVSKADFRLSKFHLNRHFSQTIVTYLDR